jgi:hypothetical protein
LAEASASDFLASSSASGDAASFWPAYVRQWTAWNHVRALSGIVAAAWLTLALSFAVWKFDPFYARFRSVDTHGPRWSSQRDLLKLGIDRCRRCSRSRRSHSWRY